MSNPYESVSMAKSPTGGMPRYLQLSTLFRRHISSGQWRDRDKIPTVEELALEYGVARATVRQALGLLESEGLIERYRAKGTFVTYKPQETLWCEVETDWSGLMRGREGATIEVLSEETGQQPPAALQTIGERAQSYRRYQRRHSRGGEPFLLANLYLDERLAKRIPASDLTSKTALNILNGVRGVKVSDVRQTMTIGAADMVTANGLNIPLNSPVAYVERSAVDDAGRLVLVTIGTYRGDLVRLDLKLK